MCQHLHVNQHSTCHFGFYKTAFLSMCDNQFGFKAKHGADQWRSYSLDLMDKSRGDKLLGAAKCDNILNEQSQSY